MRGGAKDPLKDPQLLKAVGEAIVADEATHTSQAIDAYREAISLIDGFLPKTTDEMQRTGLNQLKVSCNDSLKRLARKPVVNPSGASAAAAAPSIPLTERAVLTPAPDPAPATAEQLLPADPPARQSVEVSSYSPPKHIGPSDMAYITHPFIGPSDMAFRTPSFLGPSDMAFRNKG